MFDALHFLKSKIKTFASLGLKLLLFLFFALLIFGIFLSRWSFDIRSSLNIQNHKLFHDIKGVTHAVSEKTNGSGSYEHIIKSAKNAKLDFLFLTDFNYFESDSELRGYHNNILCLPGKKISYLDAHILMYSDETLSGLNNLGEANLVLNDLINTSKENRSNQLIAVAHPLKKGFVWSDTDFSNVDSVEVFSLRHMWQSAWINKKISFLFNVVIYIFNPEIALLRMLQEPYEEIKLWDKLNHQQAVNGLMGNHTRSKALNLGLFSFNFPTYTQSFSLASNHILLESELTGIYSRDAKKVFNALKKGQYYLAIDSLANPIGFGTYISNDKKKYFLGSQVPIEKNTLLHVDLPDLKGVNFEVKLYKDGKEYSVSRKQFSKWQLKDVGNYRVSVRLMVRFPLPGDKRWIPWIYTNNFYVHSL